jgi:hypothetical protein
MADVVKVAIVGEITDLKAKLAAAKADVKSFDDDVARLSDEIARGGAAAETQFGGQLQTASIQLIRASVNVQNFEDKIAALVPSMGKTGQAAQGAAEQVKGLVDEATSARVGAVPGAMGGASSSIALLGAAAGIAVVGVQALVGALVSLYNEAVRASDAVSRIEIGATLAGNLGIVRASVEQTIAELQKMYGVTREDAEKIAGAFSTMRGTSEEQLRGLSIAVGQYLQATGRDATATVNTVTGLLQKQRVTIEELEKVFPGLTREQYQSYAAVSQLGSGTQRAAAMSQLFLDYMKSASPQIAEYNSGIHRSWANFAQYWVMLAAGIPYQEIHDAMLQQNTKTWNEHTAAVQRDIAAMKGAAPAADEVLIAADRAAAAQAKYGDRIQDTKRNIKELEAGLATARATETGDALARDIAKYSEALKEARTNLARLQAEQANRENAGKAAAGEVLVNEARLTNAQIAADDSISKQEQIQRQIQTWNILLSSDKLTAAQRVQVQRDLATSLRQLHAAEAAEVKAAERMKADIAKDTARTDLELSRITIQEKRAALEQQVQAHQISEQQKLELMRQFAEEELQINLRVLDNSISTYEADEKEFARVENQKRILRAQTAAEIAKIDAQIEQANNRAAREDMRAWRDATNVLLSAQRTFVQGMFNSNESIKMVALRTIDTILQKEIEADLAYLTKHMLFKETELAADATAEQGGLLVKLFSEGQKTAATASGATARGAINQAEAASENTGLIIRAARWVATQLGFTAASTAGEAARTTAATTGEAARVATTTAAAATEQAIRATANVAAVESYAAVAAAGAAAAMASIPYIGPALAAAAAAETFAMLQPFAAIAALETGTMEVPKNMPAMLHQGEMVVPKTFASGIRSMLSTSPPVPGGFSTPAGRGASSGDVHVNYSPTINAPERPTLPQLVAQDASFFRAWIQSEIRDGSIKLATT